MADEQKPDGHGYGGDEEPTPAEPSGRHAYSPEARLIANIAVSLNSLSASIAECSRLYDSNERDQRRVQLARVVAELYEQKDALTDVILALSVLNGGMP